VLPAKDGLLMALVGDATVFVVESQCIKIANEIWHGVVVMSSDHKAQTPDPASS